MPGRRKKRGPGEGSIFKRKDGRWVAEVFMGYDADGRKRVARAYARTHAEAKTKLLDLLKKRAEGKPLITDRQTVAEYLHRWLEDAVSGSVRPTTLQNYRYVVRHIAEVIGDIELTKLTPQHLQYLYSRKRKEGLTRMVVLIHAVLHKALDQAVKWGLAPSNVADAVERPKFEKTEFSPLTAEEVERLLTVAQSDRLYALYAVAVTCGLRLGELLGLKWEDLDFERYTLTVRRQLQWIRGEPVFLPPKSQKSRRTIPLPQLAVAALMQHRQRQEEERRQGGEAWQEWGLVFTTAIGTPLSPSNVRKRSFYPLLRKAGLPRIRFHDLRHTTATLLLSRGVHPKIVQELLGHNQINVTLDTYSHVMAPMLRRAADEMDDVFLGQQGRIPGSLS